MPTIAEVRTQYPQYKDMSDQQLADALYSKFYSDLPRDQFNAKIGLKATPAAARSAAPRSQPKRTLLQEAAGALANVNRGLLIGDEIAAGVGTAIDVASGKARGLGDIPNLYAQNMKTQREIEDDFTARRPNSAALARGTGAAATLAVPAGGAANIYAQSPRLLNAARGAVLAGTQGAAAGLVDRGSAQERLQTASRAAVDPVTLGLGAAAGALAPARAGRSRRQISENVQTMRAEGVPLTPGQAYGGLAKTTEDALTSTPILGGAIQDARRTGTQRFNTAVANRALRHVNARVPAEVRPGGDTIAYVGDYLGRQYDDLLPRGGVRADPGFADDVARSVTPVAETLTPQSRDQLLNIVESRVSSRLGQDGTMDGQTYQRVQSELKTLIARFNGSRDADQQAIGEALGGISVALRDAAGRQNPAFGGRLRRIDRAYAEFKRMERAATSVAAEGGVFTPAQYLNAVKAGDTSVSQGQFARQEALGQDFAAAGKDVLPSTVPDSGTASRTMLGAAVSAPGAILAAGSAGGASAALTTAAGYAGAAGGLRLAAGAYSPRAIEAFNRALDERIARQGQQAALVELEQIAAQEPAVRELYREAVARLSRAAGAEGAVRQNQSIRQTPDGWEVDINRGAVAQP